MQKITNYRVIINDIELVLTTESWKSADADALVLSANNRLILRGATGLAGWLNQQCPNLHGRCAQLVQQHELRPMRGILPGYGAITEGPDGKMIIHAVTVDYDHSEFVGKSFSGMDTVAAATGYAIRAALLNQFASIAFTPMCTRGHADNAVPRNLAQYLLPQVQAQVIFGKAMTIVDGGSLKQIYFCVQDPEGDKNRKTHFETVKNEWKGLENQYKYG